MINWIIEASAKNRFIVVVAVGMLAAAGAWAISETAVDAIPDLSDVQVIVSTEYPGQSPQVVDDQVTYPLARALLATPHAKTVRGYSMFGLSLVYVIFEDGTDLYWARSRVLESLNVAQGRLPEAAKPQLGPDATGVGWVYQYTLTSDRHDLAQLRSLQDWFLRYELLSLPGVAEVASAGGYVRQYQIEIDPEKLRAYGVSLMDVMRAVQRSNVDVDGRLLEAGETEYMVRGRGYIRSIADLENVPVGLGAPAGGMSGGAMTGNMNNAAPAAEGHYPIFLKQVARVQIGPDIRRGIIEMNGEGEAVSGIIVMRQGENALAVIEHVKARLSELKASLPEGVEVHTSYDRSGLIQRGIATLRRTLIEQVVVVAIVCVVFLLHLTSSFVAVITLPLGMLASFLIMKLIGVNADIMSLGGIALAIGEMVDASVVMVENLHKHREREPDTPQLELVINASREVGPALFFSLAIMTVSFLPVFTLQQQEGRLFTPLAYAKTFAMGSAAVLSITIIPVLMYYFVRGGVMPEDKNPVSRFCIWVYRPFLRLVLRAPWLTLLFAAVVTAATWWPFARLGSEFMPPLDEGDILYMPTTGPGISVTKAREVLQQTDRLIAAHPQVAHVLGKAGRAETATDPAPLSMFETIVLLKPKEEWPAGKTLTDITRELDEQVRLPGLVNAWTMPIKTRIDMLATGIKTPIGIKLLGDDLDTLAPVAEKIEAVARGLPDTLSAYAERPTGGNYVDIDVRRFDAARFGLTVADVQDVVRNAIGGMNVTWTVEGLERYPVSIRFPRELRDNFDKLKRVPVATPLGHTIPLGDVVDLRLSRGPMEIKSENARRTVWVFVDLKTSDIGGWIATAKKTIAAEVPLPPGVSLIWSGQFEYMERAAKRLSLVVPLTLAIIFLLLFVHFRNLTESVIVMGTLPFALVGGVWLMWVNGYNLSVAVAVGFVGLAGIAAETGIVMLVYLDEAYERWRASGRLRTLADLRALISEGAVDRVRPKLMTVTTTVVGLLPAMRGDDTGASVMKRIVAPMVGGLFSSTLLTLLIIPAVYYLWKRWSDRAHLAAAVPVPVASPVASLEANSGSNPHPASNPAPKENP